MMAKIKQLMQRVRYVVGLAVLLFGTVGANLLLPATAHAFPTGGQVQSRKITLSTSATSATAVTYTVSFVSASTYNVKGIIVDFCANSPIVGDSSCTGTVGTTVPNLSGTTVTPTAGITAGTWTPSTLNSNRTFKMINSSGANSLTAASTTVTFTINGVVNPSTQGTFYARIITYTADTTGDITTYASGSEGSTEATDYGGIAMASTTTISVTAKVQESLSFCVYKTACGTAPSVPLGDANGVLNSASAFANADVIFSLSTNATSGVVVAAKGATLKTSQACSNAVTQSCSVDPINAGAATSVASTTNTEQFGFCIAPGAGVTAAAPYSDAGCSTVTTATTPYAGSAQFGFDTTSGTNITSASGMTVASTAGPVSAITSNLAFLGNVSNTTQAGIYTSNITLTATGTF